MKKMSVREGMGVSIGHQKIWKTRESATKTQIYKHIYFQRFHQILKGHAQHTDFSFINAYVLVSIQSNDFHQDGLYTHKFCFFLIHFIPHCSPLCLLPAPSGPLSSYQPPLISYICVLSPFLFLASFKISYTLAQSLF